MRYPKWFARWRVTVWDRRLKEYRAEWNKPRPTLELGDWKPLDAVDVDAFWERMVTKAMLKRVMWRKRAGVRLRDDNVRYDYQRQFLTGTAPRPLCGCTWEHRVNVMTEPAAVTGPHHLTVCPLFRKVSAPGDRPGA